MMIKGERQLKRAQAYFNEHFDEFLREFPGEYVAIIQDEVVYHQETLVNSLIMFTGITRNVLSS